MITDNKSGDTLSYSRPFFMESLFLLEFSEEKQAFVIKSCFFRNSDSTLKDVFPGRSLVEVIPAGEWEILRSYLLRLYTGEIEKIVYAPACEFSGIRINLCRFESGTISMYCDSTVEQVYDIPCISYFTQNQADLFVSLDSSLVITTITPSSLLLTGYAPGELIGHALSEFCHPGDIDEMTIFFTALCHDRSDRIKFRIRKKNGEYVWFESVFACIYSEVGRVAGILGVCREMDAGFRAELAIKNANKKLNALNSIIRHDVLNQITGMLGYLEILQEMVSDDEISYILTKEQEIGGTIRSLITTTQFYQGIGMKPPEWHDVDLVVHKVLNRHEFIGKCTSERSLEGLFIYADRLFEQVIYQLVNNSIRIAGSGVHIRFWYEILEASLVLYVGDSGPGVDPRDKERIFTRNHRAKRDYGLYLSTEILDITDITIRENGVFGKGARFDITVPLGGFRFREEI